MKANEWDAMLETYAVRIRMALAEAGYPNADVYVEPSGVFVGDDVPEDVAVRAAEICRQR